MTTFTATTAGVVIDTGTAGLLSIRNSGSRPALVTVGAQERPDLIWPGGFVNLSPIGRPVTATTKSGTTTLEVTTTVADDGIVSGPGRIEYDDLSAACGQTIADSY